MRLLVSRVFSLSASFNRAPLRAERVVGPRLTLTLNPSQRLNQSGRRDGRFGPHSEFEYLVVVLVW